MSVNILTDISAPKPQINCRCWDLIVDGDSIIHGSHTVDGNVTVNGNITINGTVDIPSGSLQVSDLSPGPAGSFLVTDSIGTSVIWSALPPIVVPPGAPNSIFQTNSTGGGTVWNTDLIVPGNATIAGDAVVGDEVSANSVVAATSIISNGTINSVGVLTTNSNLQVDGSATIAFDCNCEILNCNILNTTGDIFCGEDLAVNKTVNITETLTVGTSSFLNGSVTCGSDLTLTNVASTLLASGAATINGTTTLNGTTNITNNLQLNGSSGASGAVIYKTGATTQAWTQLSTLLTSLLPSFRRDFISCAADIVQNLNSPSTTIQWSASFLQSTFTYGASVYLPVQQNTQTDWRIRSAGTYQIGWRANLTGAGISTSQIYTQLTLNGAPIGPRCPSGYGALSSGATVVSLGQMTLNLTNGDIIRIIGFKNFGNDALSTVIDGTYIYISLVSIMV